ncbi:MAG: U32 family peptidase [Firmicutes bacterium]|nr:U32 family peptidase [Bacillota bacterium]
MKPELLAPAGDLEKLRTAIVYGADAVYLGGQAFSLRAGAGNFNEAELIEALYHAHANGVRVYVAINIYAKNNDLQPLEEYVRWLEAAGVDAVIVSDVGVFQTVRRVAPGLEVHISTQASTSNTAGVNFWGELGARRVVLARELNLEEIKDIADNTEVELETFIHGAMCMAWSGRCLISSFLTGRSANRGDCAQPCRWKYHLVEAQRPGEYMHVEEDERGTYIFNARDLCMLPYVPQLAAAGIASFKIEGRMKSVHYLATVVNAYRQAIDAWWQQGDNYQLDPAWLEELDLASHRPWSTGFYFGAPGAEGQFTEHSRYLRHAAFVGVVRGWQDGELLVEQRGNFARGQTLDLVLPGSKPVSIKVEAMTNAEGRPLERAPHAQQLVKIPWPQPVPEFTVLRRREQ